jgi:hypothetical protein
MTYNYKMDFAQALRILAPPTTSQTICLVGAGGKTTALFNLARKYSIHSAVIVTATSHLGVWQIPLADHHIIATTLDDLQNLPKNGVVLVTGEVENERTKPVDTAIISWLHEKSQSEGIYLLIEADGSRQKSLKAPATHEPPIPNLQMLSLYQLVYRLSEPHSPTSIFTVLKYFHKSVAYKLTK